MATFGSVELTICVLVRNLGVRLGTWPRLLLGSNRKILIDFVWFETIFRSSIPKPSISIHFPTAPRNDFANPVTKANANCKNYDTWQHLRVYTPRVERRFKSSAITLIGAKFPL